LSDFVKAAILAFKIKYQVVGFNQAPPFGEHRLIAFYRPDFLTEGSWRNLQMKTWVVTSRVLWLESGPPQYGRIRNMLSSAPCGLKNCWVPD
jgi:hypothetical protein